MATIDGSPLGEVNDDLYAHNAFRVSGLPVSATSRDIRRRSEQLRVMAQLGTAAATGPGVLPPARPPSASAVADALERLRDPARRLVDELFWLWPAGGDEAMDALRRGDADAAMSTWESAGGGTGPEAAVARHNVAVLAHARALEDPGLSSATMVLWHRAYRHWAAVYASDTFWELVNARIAEMSDPRLSPATARQMREALPSALLSINAGLALRARREGHPDEAAAHVSLLSGSGFGADAAGHVSRQHAEPLLAQLRSMGRDAERSADGDPGGGAEAARTLLGQAGPLLADLGLFLPDEHPLAQGIRDEVASTALRCVVRYVNQAGDPRGGRDVLDLALPIAATDAARKRIRENLDIVAAMIKRADEQLRLVRLYGTCWFDKTSPATKPDAFPQKMYGEVRRSYVSARTTRVTWRAQTVSVPRCAVCREAHAARRRTNRVAGWAVFLGGIILAVVFFAAGVAAAGVTLILLSLVIALPVAAGLSATTGIPGRDRASLRDFEPVKALLAAGWKLGAKPNTR